MTWKANKRTGEIRNRLGHLIATTEFGQRQHTELLGQAQKMRKLLRECLDAGLPQKIDADVRKMLFRTR